MCDSESPGKNIILEACIYCLCSIIAYCIARQQHTQSLTKQTKTTTCSHTAALACLWLVVPNAYDHRAALELAAGERDTIERYERGMMTMMAIRERSA